MKKKSTIQREIRRLRAIIRKNDPPSERRIEAFAAWHALLWTLDGTDHRPSTAIAYLDE